MSARWTRLAGAALLAAGCQHTPARHHLLMADHPEWRLEQLRFQGFTPSEPQAARGLDALLAGGDFHYGVPERYYRDILDVGAYSPSQLWTFGHLPSPPGRDTQGLPFLSVGHSAFESHGDRKITFNCLTCHAGVAGGTVVAGLPNSNFDAFTLEVMAKAIVRTYDHAASRETMALRHTAAAMEDIRGTADYARALVLPTFDSFPVRGDNPGAYVLWRLNARLTSPGQSLALADPATRTALEAELFPTGFRFPPIEPMPWWNLQYKRRAYWTQDGETHAAVTFALNQMDQHPDNAGAVEAKLARTDDYLAFARSTEPPPFPGAIDAALAEQGRALFHGAFRCATCHGTYDGAGKLQSYPELPNLDVGTDPSYVQTLMKFGELYRRTDAVYARFRGTGFHPEGEHAIRQPDRVGYVAPPLVGIWASAPYFHNGSVPTVEGVLDSSKRPALWMKTMDPWRFDADALGAFVEQTFTDAEYAHELEATQGSRELNTESQLQFRRIYNTRQFGRSNAGHTYGDAMTASQRKAVLEYLKRL